MFSNFSRFESAKRYPHHLELSRLFVVDGTPKNTESFFIGKCLRWLRDNDKTVIGIVTYADPTAGHSGCIYKAANFKFVGMTGSSYHYADSEGNRHHKRSIHKKSRKEEVSERAYATDFGLTRVPELPKLKFKYKLQKKDLPPVYGEIYKITNAVNGKVYIGQTVRGWKTRFGDHKNEARNPSTRFHRAMAEHGFANFSVEVLATAQFEEELDQLEAYHIDLHQASDPTRGYNEDAPYSGEIFRIPDEVLYRTFEMRQAGKRLTDISDILGISMSLISNVHRGADRPHLRDRWQAENGDFYAKLRAESGTRYDRICDEFYIKERSVTDIASLLNLKVDLVERVIFGSTVGDKFSVFQLRYIENLSAPAIAEKLNTSAAYVTKVLAGALNPFIKKAWESKHGVAPYQHRGYLTREQIDGIFTAIYVGSRTVLEVSASLKVLPGRVRRLLWTASFAEIREQWFKNHPSINQFLEKNVRISKAILGECFKHREAGMTVEAIANLYDINVGWLSSVFRGYCRPNILKEWLASGKSNFKEVVRANLSQTQSKTRSVHSSLGGDFNGLPAAAKHFGVSTQAIYKCLKFKKPLKTLDGDVFFEYTEKLKRTESGKARRTQKYRIVETGQVFDSAIALAEFAGCHTNEPPRSIRLGRKLLGKWAIERV